jgi:hypothetical protein
MLKSLTESLSARGADLAALGGAYVFLLGSVVLTIAAFVFARSYLVVSPNRAARHYGLYVVMALATLAVAAVLERELVPQLATTLPYAAVPQLLILIAIHLRIYYDQQPWLISLGAAAAAGTVGTMLVAAVVTDLIHVAHWLSMALLTALLAYLWVSSISTKRGFIKAQSIYIESKEGTSAKPTPQRPWLGLPQWVALSCASLLLTTLNAVLRGSGLAQVPALDVIGQSSLLLGVTATVCAIPASTYWLAHKHWMPELTRFVWLVWVVVGFAFTYSNFLVSLERA